MPGGRRGRALGDGGSVSGSSSGGGGGFGGGTVDLPLRGEGGAGGQGGRSEKEGRRERGGEGPLPLPLPLRDRPPPSRALHTTGHLPGNNFLATGQSKGHPGSTRARFWPASTHRSEQGAAGMPGGRRRAGAD